MLILVAGITGFVGIPVAEAALKRGYQVRGLARNPDRLSKGLLERLESFETLTGPHDIAALERAVAGVDAVVSTIAATAETIMETQVLLLKAAERAGVKIFHASTWNLDWRRSPGTHEVYDSLAHFAHHASMTSTIKPIYMFTGAIAEWYFVRSAKDWDRETKTVIYHGDPAFKTRYTTANDIANYVLEAITAPDAAEGAISEYKASRHRQTMSWRHTMRRGKGRPRLPTSAWVLWRMRKQSWMKGEPSIRRRSGGITPGISTSTTFPCSLGTTNRSMLPASPM
ncbi:hypothetical protein V2G26_018716 [Clonostachys chloroleuca]